MALSPEHRAARLGKITSSVVAGVLDVDPHSSPRDALAKIRGEDTFSGNKHTERGEVFEPSLIAYAARVTGLVARSAEFVEGPTGTDGHAFSGDSADALLVDDAGQVRAVVEAKTVNQYAQAGYGEEGTDDIPERVILQAHWHLIHWPEAKLCYVPVAFGGSFTLALYIVPRDEAFEKLIYGQAEVWHRRHVVEKVPVPWGSSACDTRALQARAPRDWAGMVPGTDELAKLVQQRIDADAALRKAEKERDRLSNLLREAVGEHEGIELDQQGLSCTYRKNSAAARVNWMEVARELRAGEDIIARHTEVVPGPRILRVGRQSRSRRAGAKDA